jgi:hypothetical protein
MDTMPPSQSADAGNLTDSVARLAYELFLARGAVHGRDLDDWLTAESQLRAGAGGKKRRTRTPAVADQAIGRSVRRQADRADGRT